MRLLSVGLLSALMLSLGLTWYLQRPQWETFYTASDPAEVTGLTGRLDELKVQYKISGNGMTIMIPSSERSAANLAKAQAGLPSGGHVGLEIFAEPKFGATEFDKKVQYKRALEGELGRSLMRLGDIQSVKVNLNLPEQTVFVRDRQQPSAGVVVTPKPGRSLSKENVLAMMNFVASSVEGLSIEKVTVISDKGVDLSKGLADAGHSAGMDEESLAQQRMRETQLTEKVLSVLEPIFGIGNVAATVTVEIDYQSVRTEERLVGQAVPKTTTTERSGSQTSGSTNGNSPAANPLDPTLGTTSPPIYQQSANSESSDSFTSRSTTQFDVGEKNQVTVSPAGSVKRISTAVTINRPELSQNQIDQIRQQAATAIGATVADVSVLAMSFSLPPGGQTPVAAEPKPIIDPTALAIGLGIASFFLILAFFLTRRRKPEQEFALPGFAGQPVTGTTLDVALGLDQPAPVGQQAVALAGGGSESMSMEGAGAVQAGPAPEAAAVAQRLEEVLKKRKPKRAALDVEDFLNDDILADIEVLIDQAPEACAEVIRQWLKGGI